MQIQRIGYGIRGFGRITGYAIRWTRMVTTKAKHKARVLAFWGTYGLYATIDAFKISRRTLYLWKTQQQAGQGKLESLNEQSKRPKKVRTRAWSGAVIAAIKTQRAVHPNLGPDKIAVLLHRDPALKGLALPQARTVARIIADAPDKMRIFPVKVRHNGKVVQRKKAKKTRKPKGFKAAYAGHCGAFDTVEKIIQGCRRYVITFTDLHSRFSWAYGTTSHASAAAQEFFSLVTRIFPFPLTYVLTDNGSEFMKHFDAKLRRLHRVHWHTYPRTPKMNAHDERFNRTIQEEFVNYHEPELQHNLVRFNELLTDHLLWHNGERPHWSLQLKSPIQFLTEQHPELCNMWWRDTKAGQTGKFRV